MGGGPVGARILTGLIVLVSAAGAASAQNNENRAWHRYKQLAYSPGLWQSIFSYVAPNTTYNPGLATIQPNVALDEVSLRLTFKPGYAANIEEFVRVTNNVDPALEKIQFRHSVIGQDLILYYGFADRMTEHISSDPNGWRIVVNGNDPLSAIQILVTYHVPNAAAMPDLYSPTTAGEVKLRGFASPQVAAMQLDAEQGDQAILNNSTVPIPSNAKLIVLVHGWNNVKNSNDQYVPHLNHYAPTDKATTDPLEMKWKTLYRNLSENALANGWFVSRYDWARDAATGRGDLETWPIETRDNANASRDAGHAHGLKLGQILAAANPTHVHFIAHSAGNWAARRAAQHLKWRFGPNVTVQLTSLDPFINDGDPTLGADMNCQPFFELANQWFNRLDNYFVVDAATDFLFWTSGHLDGWVPSLRLDSGNPPLWQDYMDEHGGPVAWYALTALQANTLSSAINGNLGFGVSLARGNSQMPAVRVLAPLSGSTVAGVVSLSAEAIRAGDNASINMVRFFVDGNQINEDLSAPYGFQWNTTGSFNGGHVIAAIAYDALGRTATEEVLVTVSNSGLALANPNISGSGTSRTFGITYTHTGNVAPSFVRLVMQGQGTFAMAATTPGDTNYADGKTYFVTLTLPNGTHTYRFEASDGSLSASTGDYQVTVSSSASQLSVVATPNPVSEFSTTQLSATVNDAGGNPMAGQTITFSTWFNGTFSGGNISFNVATTNAAGVAVVNFTPNISGTAYVTATVNSTGLSREIPVTVTANGNIVISLGISFDSGNATQSIYRLNANITQNGLPIPNGTPVSWTPGPTLGSITSQDNFTQAGGAQADLTTTASGNAIVSVTVSGTTKSISTNLTVGPPPAFAKYKTLPYNVPVETGGQIGWLSADTILALPNGTTNNNIVTFWNFLTNTAAVSPNLSRATNSGRSSPDGTKFLVGQDSGEFSVLAPDGSVLSNFDPGSLFQINSAAWIDNSSYLIGTRWDVQASTNAIVSARNSGGGEIRRYNVSAFWNASTNTGTVRSVATYTGSPMRIAAGSHNSFLKVWNETGSELYSELNVSGQTPGDKICDMAFSPDGTRLVVVGDGFGVIYNTSTWSKQAIANLPVSESWTACFVTLPAGAQIAIGRDDSKVSIHDLNGTLVKQADASGRVSGVAWNNTRKVLAASTDAGTDLFNLGTDFQGPDLNASAPTSVPFNTTTLNISGTITDPSLVDTATVDVNGGGPVSLLPLGGGGAFSQLVPLNIGVNGVVFQASDKVGNSSTLTLTITRLSDTTPPAAGNAQTTPEATIGAMVPLTVTVTDSESGVASVSALIQRPNETTIATVPLSDAGSGIFTGSWDSTGQPEGGYVVDFVSSDVSGNASELENGVGFTLNDAPAVGAVSHLPAGPTDTQSVLVSASITDQSGIGSATLLYSTGGGFVPIAMAFNGATSMYEATISAQNAGLVQYKIQATDVLTNAVETSPVAYTVTDASPPVFFGTALTPSNLTENTVGALRVATYVIDPGGSGAATPQIQYQRGTEDAVFSSWQDLTLNAGKWEFDIPMPAATWDAIRGQSVVFRFRALDVAGNLGTSADQAELVDSINDAPTGNAAPLAATEDSSSPGTLTGQDVEGDAITFTIAANGSKGTAVITNASTGAFTYTPNGNANGLDTFTFTVHDGTATSLPAVITVTIAPVNDAPVANNAGLNVTQDTPKTGSLSATDVDGDTLTFAITINGTRGSAALTNVNTGAFTYTPNAGEAGADSFSFSVTDGQTSNVATVSVTITLTPVAPSMTSAAVTAASAGLPYTYDVQATGTPAPTYSLSVLPAGMTINPGSGVLSWTPTFAQMGAHAVTVVATNGTAPDATQSFTVTVTPPAPGANDNFANAVRLIGATWSLMGSNAGATVEAGEPAHGGLPGGHSVWQIWTAPTTGTATIDTFGSSFDTLLAVYTGAAVNALALVAENNDSGGPQSEVTFSTVAGTTYLIAIDGAGGATGTVQLNLTTTTALSNGFANAQILPDGTAGLGSNAGATLEGGEPPHGPNASGASVWIQWTAPADGSFTATTLGSDFDTTLAIYTGNSLATLVQVAANDDAGSLTTSVATFTAVAGTTYHIAVDGSSLGGGAATGTVVLNVAPVPPPGGGGGGGGCGCTGLELIYPLIVMWLTRRRR